MVKVIAEEVHTEAEYERRLYDGNVVAERHVEILDAAHREFVAVHVHEERENLKPAVAYLALHGHRTYLQISLVFELQQLRYLP